MRNLFAVLLLSTALCGRGAAYQNATVSKTPSEIRDVFTQSAAEEIIHQREAALLRVEALGGLALDVTTRTLAPKLLESYLRVKERGML